MRELGKGEEEVMRIKMVNVLREGFRNKKLYLIFKR